MTFHPRSDWTSVPAADANPVIVSKLKGVAIHWNGPAVPASALKDPRSFLEGVRRFHVSTRGWSDIAYNLAVDQNGDVWELRGLKHQSAANGDEPTNDAYLAIFCIVGEGQVPSDAMIAGVRKAVRRFRRRYPLARKIVGHKDIRPAGTECPGARLQTQLLAGNFVPRRCRHCKLHCPKEGA